MSTPNPPSTGQGPVNDPLLQRYQEASAHDATQPSPALRERVLAHARAMAEEQSSPLTQKRPLAANDSAWKLRALGSLAVLGLVGLLVLQFDQGTPEEKGVAWGPATPRSPSPSPSAASAEAQASKAGPDRSPALAGAMRDPLPSAAQHLPGASADQRSAAPPSAPTTKPPPPQLPGIEGSRSRRETAPVQAEETTGVVAAPEQERQLDASPEPAMNQVQPLPSAAKDTGAPLSTRRDEPLKERSASLAKKPVSSTALHEATKAADPEAVRRALAQGFSVDAPDSEGRTALMLAAQGPSKAVVEQLLKAGADRALRDRQGLNAADHARLAGRLTWLELLQP